MQSILIVSSSEKMTAFFTEMLSQTIYDELQIVKTCGEARRLLVERSFDLCIINSPLPDESGDKLATYIIGEKANQVILVVKQEYADEVSSRVEDYGVFTVDKPISRSTFWLALKMTESAYKRLNNIKNENAKLKQKLNDIKLVSRAKILLIERENISEEEAHKMLEQEAMNKRKTRGEIAQEIINRYDE